MHHKIDKLEILYDGYYYDVTEFSKRHPGGDIILYYTEKGEDATQAIQQFHNRFFRKVRSMMSNLKRRPAPDNESPLTPEERNRHQNITNDFNELFSWMQTQGLFAPSPLRNIWRIIECSLIWMTGVYFCGNSRFSLQFLGAVLFGLGAGRAGWVMHEAGHHSLTGNHKADRLIQSIILVCVYHGHFLGVLDGVAGGWWRRHHNKHHAMPQRIDYDLDLNTMPVVANAIEIVKDGRHGRSFFIQNQKWLFLALDCCLATMAWRMYSSPRTPWTIIFGIWVAGTYLFGNFALSHSRLPVAKKQTHWVEYAFRHTANIKSSLWMDWWTGYLNFEIVHHLFPTLPPFRSYLVRDKVMALAAKYDLPYNEVSYMEAWAQNFRNLDNVAKHFKQM
ncbi:acyl-lipid (8-3)-desaturase isoform X3 [Folsomia candida]|uniref:acyl-lipid (8-3)-desaturase isoform X3 n=1 Tax=Folsomia candida TaxID=158441 RepID=UPI001604B9EF|nr:acyl-lipid (8-3)-desaturase isoform X3 [Folsomia candida]